MNRVLNRLGPLFEKMEVFLWAFLMQDAVAMWVPRIWVSLERGSKKYDPTLDPAMRGQPLSQQIKSWVVNNIKGLNWVNFNEETKREFATGPGVLMIPTVAFALARRAFGKNSVELGHGPLTALKDGFVEHLKKQNLLAEGPVQDAAAFRQQYQNGLKTYIASLFDDEVMKKQPVSEALAKKHHVQTYGQYIDDWADRYTQAVFAEYDQSLARQKQNVGQRLNRQWQGLKTMARDVGKAIQNQPNTLYKKHDGLMRRMWTVLTDAPESKLDQLAAELDTVLVKGYNRNHRILAEEIETLAKQGLSPERIKALKAPLHKTDQIWTRIDPTKPARLKSLGSLTDELLRWKDYAMTVYQQKGKGFANKLPDLAEKVYQKLVVRKGLLSVGATLAAGLYLIRLAFWAQSHDTYVANRLLDEPGADHAPEPAKPTSVKQGLPSAPQPNPFAYPMASTHAYPAIGFAQQTVSPYNMVPSNDGRVK